MNEDDVERQYQGGVHIGSGLPRATCPCGFCQKHRHGFNQGDAPIAYWTPEMVAAVKADAKWLLSKIKPGKMADLGMVVDGALYWSERRGVVTARRHLSEHDGEWWIHYEGAFTLGYGKEEVFLSEFRRIYLEPQ
ncbi:hypothetical protein NDK50_07990 [Paraburkholderia bryophila]|uniref:hypothetical protein n=1 Tax=Paraburkholderia bryophila TaxID=420952 RepID=UPI0023491DB1|nr:hypothetical protein [Paraburkholderia bryophila]WCM21376.1 hypothetical protein NDK50_07990 [Paraburkholderia bryophila]